MYFAITLDIIKKNGLLIDCFNFIKVIINEFWYSIEYQNFIIKKPSLLIDLIH